MDENTGTQNMGQGSSSKTMVWISIIVLILIIGGILAWAFNDSQTSAVATVNDETISRTIFDARVEQMAVALAAQGLPQSQTEANKGQIQDAVLEELINEELLVQAALDADVSVSEEEIDEVYEETKSSFPDEETFVSELERFSLTPEIVRENIRRRLLIQKFVETEFDLDALDISEEDIRALYAQYEGQIDDLPPYEEVEADLRSQLEQEEVNTLVVALIERLKAEASIEVHISTASPLTPQAPISSEEEADSAEGEEEEEN